MNDKAVITISGGLDSSTILHNAYNKGYDIYPVFLNYGQKHLKKEYDCALVQVGSIGLYDRLKVLNLDFFRDISKVSALTNQSLDIPKTRDILGDAQPVSYVPFRNLMILSICCAYAESVKAKTVMYGAAQVDSQAGYWDGSIEFINRVNELTGLNRKNHIKIEAPLIELSKKEIIELGIKNKVVYSNTWTCYEGKEISCGQCPACSSRIKGFIDAKQPDPLKYNIDINWKKLIYG